MRMLTYAYADVCCTCIQARQHTTAYVSIRIRLQSAGVSIRAVAHLERSQRRLLANAIRDHSRKAQRIVAPAHRLRMRHHLYSGTSAYVSIRTRMQAQRIVAPAHRLRMRHHLYLGTSANASIRQHTHKYAVCMHLEVVGVERQRVASAVRKQVHELCRLCIEALVRR